MAWLDEIAQAGHRPDAVVLSVRCGGLLAGVVAGLQRNNWADDVPVFAVETEGRASFHTALNAGQLVTLDSIRSVASSLGASLAMLYEHVQPLGSCQKILVIVCGSATASIDQIRPWVKND